MNGCGTVEVYVDSSLALVIGSIYQVQTLAIMPPEKAPRYTHSVGGSDGPQSRSGRFREEKNALSLPGIEQHFLCCLVIAQ